MHMWWRFLIRLIERSISTGSYGCITYRTTIKIFAQKVSKDKRFYVKTQIEKNYGEEEGKFISLQRLQ